MMQKATKSLASKALLAALFLGALAGSALADDAYQTLGDAAGAHQFGFQNSNGSNVTTITSLGTVTISSNTILPQTTFYQNGVIRMGVSGSSIAFFGASPVPKQSSGTDLGTALVSLGFYTNTSSFPFNSGTGALSQGVATTSLANGNFAISNAGLLTKSDGIATAGIGLPVIVTVITKAGQVANIAAANLYTPPAAGGLFRLHYYMATSALMNNPVYLSLLYEDPYQSANQTVQIATLGAALGAHVGGVFVYEVKNATTPQYKTTNYGNGTYNLYMTVERLN